MKIVLDIKSLDNVGDLTPEKLAKFVEIFEVLIEKGALTGIKGGCVKIHFSAEGMFMGVELDYWPWRRRA